MAQAQQRHLFPMPGRWRHKLTRPQRSVLDWVAINAGGVAFFPDRLSRVALRTAIERALVAVVGYSPARYALTPLGQAVRSSYVGRAGRSPPITDPTDDSRPVQKMIAE